MQKNQGTSIEQPKTFAPHCNQLMKPHFETQKWYSLKCGLHAVNHLLGRQEFKDNDFDKICKELHDMTLEHYSHRLLGGDYDVSVLIKALNSKLFEVEWHDARKEVNQNMLRSQEEGTVLQGYLLNLKMPQRFCHSLLKFSGRHWIAIKITDPQTIIKMDSKQKDVQFFSKEELLLYLEKERSEGSQILKVYKRTKKNEKMQEK